MLELAVGDTLMVCLVEWNDAGGFHALSLIKILSFFSLATTEPTILDAEVPPAEAL